MTSARSYELSRLPAMVENVIALLLLAACLPVIWTIWDD